MSLERASLARGIAAALTSLALLAAACGRGSSQPASRAEREEAGMITVFAAASLTDPLQEIGAAFEREHPGVAVRFNFAGSPTLATQILSGAPADLFLSADESSMRGIVEPGLARAATPLATSRLAIVAPRANPAAILVPADLARPGVKLVLAAPGVPIGDYSRRMLEQMGLLKGAEANLVSQEIDVKGVLGKVLLGEADAGIVYETDVTPRVAPRVAVVPIPEEANVRATCFLCVLERGPNPAGASAFGSFLRSDVGRAVMRRYNFGLP